MAFICGVTLLRYFAVVVQRGGVTLFVGLGWAILTISRFLRGPPRVRTVCVKTGWAV